MPDDLRFYQPKPIRNDEPLYIQCPECGNIQEIHIKECIICGYDLRVSIEKLKGGSKSKKSLERLVLIKSMQDEMYNKLIELVQWYGYKKGYSYHLFRDLLSSAKSQGTGLKFYSKILNRIERCKAKGYKLQWLKYQ